MASRKCCVGRIIVSNSSASTRLKFPDGADVLPSIIDHFIQLISCWFLMHLKCQTLMLSIRHWKWENTLFSELFTDHLHGGDLELIKLFSKKSPRVEKKTGSCFLCYSSPNWFKNSESLRWHVDDLLFIFELRQRRCRPLVWCCVMKRFPRWHLLLCFLILITKLQHLLFVQLWSLSCHKPSKWNQRCSWVCVNYFHMMLQAHKVPTCTHICYNTFFVICVLYMVALRLKGQTGFRKCDSWAQELWPGTYGRITPKSLADSNQN